MKRRNVLPMSGKGKVSVYLGMDSTKVGCAARKKRKQRTYLFLQMMSAGNGDWGAVGGDLLAAFLLAAAVDDSGAPFAAASTR